MSSATSTRCARSCTGSVRVGGLGLALLAGAAVFHFSAVRPASRELATLQLRASEVEKRARPAAPAAVASDDIDRFVGFFPPFESAPSGCARFTRSPSARSSSSPRAATG